MLTTPVLADQLRVAIGRLARRLRQQSIGGLTPSQISVLSTLDTQGEMAMGRLATHEAISAPSATGIVGRLLEKGLVERTPDPTDLRSLLVGITTEGTAALVQRRHERTAYLTTRIEALSDSDREVLSAAVRILESVYESP